MNSLDKSRNGSSEKNDDISILDFIITFLKYKRLALSVVIITMSVTILFVVVSNRGSEKIASVEEPAAQNLYYSECLIEPYALPVEKVFTILNRVNKSIELLENTEIYSILYPDLWDEGARKWKTSPPPSRRDTYNLLKPNLGLFVSGNYIAFGYLSDHPDIPQRILNCYLTGLSEYLRERDKNGIKAKLDLLNGQLRLESDVQVKHALSSEIIQLKYAQIRLNDKLYGFSVIDYPFQPWKPDAKQIGHIKYKIKEIEDRIDGGFTQKYEKMKKPLPPARSTSGKMIILLMAFASIVLAAFAILLVEYFRKLKQDRPA